MRLLAPHTWLDFFLFVLCLDTPLLVMLEISSLLYVTE